MRGRALVIHPFLLAIYPILSIYTANIDRIRGLYILRPLLLSLSYCLVMFMLVWLVTRNSKRAGLITSILLILFFSYGHVYALIEGKTLAGFAIGRHRILLIVWAGLFLSGSWWILRRLKDSGKATALANVIALAALVMPILNITTYYYRQQTSTARAKPQAEAEIQEEASLDPDLENLPDIYYIILDAYGRQDVLQQLYGYDNAPLMKQLESLGFTIASESRTNYGQTGLSIASSLNMDYIQTILDELNSERRDYQQLLELVKQSRVRSIVESYGYKTMAFSTGYWLTEINDADLYLEYGDSQAKGNVLGSMSKIGQVNPFEVMVVQSTAAILITDYVTHCVNELDVYQASTPQEREQRGIYQSGWKSIGCVLFEGLHETLNYPFREHRERIQYAFDKLPELAEVSEPHFVFAHFIAPHFPFVFGPDGEVGTYLEETGLPFWESSFTYEEYLNGYTGQITFVDKRIQQILQDILLNSEREPIIIVQADHGPDLTARLYEPPALEYLLERFPILNAYYLPSYCQRDQLYTSVTPVNSFRVVFNACFGTDYELLEDRSYWSFYDRPYKFEDVTEKVKP
jgi:Sulfatase